GVKCAIAAFGVEIVTVGPAVWVHAKVSGLPSGSLDPEPSSVTWTPVVPVASGPALATGARLPPAMLTPPETTSANGCAELGTLNARTVIVYVPAAGVSSVTCSTLLRRSAAPPVVDWLFANTLPRKVPDGPETWRSRSLLRLMLAAGVDGKSVHASVTRRRWPAATFTENVRV